MDLIEEVRALRKAVDNIADMLTRVGVGPKLMKITEVAELMGVTVAVIYEWRAKGEGPPFLHITPRTVRYDRDDVIAWAQSHRVAA